MDQLSETAINAVAELARANALEVVGLGPPQGIPGLPQEIPALLDPRNGVAKSLKPLLEEYRQKPERKRGTAVVDTLESFIDLVERHKTDHSVIFASIDWKKPALTAVIDYHDKDNGGAADNGQHRIHYPFPLSEEWQAWVSGNGEKMNQRDFAEFIEDRIAELATPDEGEATYWESLLGGRVAAPNDIMILSRGLKVNAETRVSNNVVLATGEAQIAFAEEHRGENGDRINVPSMFIIRLPTFFRGEAVRIPVRLRYRVASGAVTWFYQLYNPEKFVTEEVERGLSRAAGATDLPSFVGAPEMTA